MYAGRGRSIHLAISRVSDSIVVTEGAPGSSGDTHPIGL
jgi:hypothetical protein